MVGELFPWSTAIAASSITMDICAFIHPWGKLYKPNWQSCKPADYLSEYLIEGSHSRVQLCKDSDEPQVLLEEGKALNGKRRSSVLPSVVLSICSVSALRLLFFTFTFGSKVSRGRPPSSSLTWTEWSGMRVIKVGVGRSACTTF